MNRSTPAAAKHFSAGRAVFIAALACALLTSAGPTARRAALADDSPGTTPAGAAPSKAKQQTAKPDTIKKLDSVKPAKPAGAQSPSIAGDLLDERPPSDLDNQLLDGLPPAKKSPAKRSPAKSPSGQPPAPAADADRPPVVEGPVLGEDADPLSRIGEQMRGVERRLKMPRQGDKDMQAMQGQIVEELARLIEQMEQQQNSPPSGTSTQAPPSGSPAERKSVRQPGATPGTSAAAGNRPAKESTERLGQAEVRAPSADEIRGLMKDVWGQLPAREREQMLQSPPEQFLPKYELLLEKYYKRLADEQQHRP